MTLQNAAIAAVKSRLPILSAAGLSIVLLTSCASLYVNAPGDMAMQAGQYGVAAQTGAEACRDSLGGSHDAAGESLDASNIRMINWNIRKLRDPESDDDLDKFSSGMDLILIQEALLREETIDIVDATKHWSFAPGYQTSRTVSGVLTLSSIKPLTQCSFVAFEPLLRSPKATSITEYDLTSTDQTLVVVNIHAVNFSTGLGAFRNQFEQVSQALANHRGPIIFSGDLNTWRDKRLQVVEHFADSLSLEPITFGDDHRVKIFGNVLDHIYVRGLSTVYTSTEAVETSDHNPMSATFSMM